MKHYMLASPKVEYHCITFFLMQAQSYGTWINV